MNFALGADHRGFEAIRAIADRLKGMGHHVEIMGQLQTPCDYPEPASLVAHAVARKRADLGVLICGTGIGMSIAANKVAGARAAVAHDEMTAAMSRSHNDANILCLSADLLGVRLIEKILDSWIRTPFEGGRHARRIHKIDAIERGEDPASVKD